jgi:hypothetical protein
MRYIVVILGVLALAGCKSQEERLVLEAQRDHQACANMGYERGTALYLQCRQVQTNGRMVEQMRTEAAQRDFGNRLSRAGAALQSIDRQPVNTNCSRTYTGFNCSTY